jgi:hypothetical protein
MFVRRRSLLPRYTYVPRYVYVRVDLIQAGLAMFPNSAYMVLLHGNFMIDVLGVSQSGSRRIEVRTTTVQLRARTCFVLPCV